MIENERIQLEREEMIQELTEEKGRRLTSSEIRSVNEKFPLIRDDSIYEVLTHLAQVEAIDYDVGSMKIISFLVTFMSFYIITYFGNLMSTDLVTVKEPQLIESYEDLLMRERIQTLFMGFQQDYLMFENAPEDDISKKIWKKSLQTVENKRDQLFIQIDNLLGTAASSIAKTVDASGENQTEVVAVMGSFVSPVARATACQLKSATAFREWRIEQPKLWKPIADIYTWVARDESENDVLVSSVFRKGFNTPLAKRIDKRAQYMYETGTHVNLFKLIRKPALGNQRKLNAEESDEYRKCTAVTIQENMKKPAFSSMRAVQFRVLFLVNLGIVAFALIVLLYEVYIGSGRLVNTYQYFS